jgi:predicted ATPase
LITEIEVKNFKTLRDVTIPLAPAITVMVGANNSGKSNALAVLKLLREANNGRLEDAVAAMGGLDVLRSRGSQGPFEILAKATRATSDYRYRIRIDERSHDDGVLSSDGKNVWPVEGEALDLHEALATLSVHDFSVAALRAPAVVRADAVLGPDGSDVAAVLDSMAGDAPALRDAVDETVRRAAHEVRRVVTRSGATPGTKVLGVEETDGRVYGAEDISDGLLLFIGLAVATQLREAQHQTIAIEEPERGIHPRRLRDLVDHLLRLTKAGAQVVLTTHSPTLLDEFRDSPESVLIFDRDDKGTHITRLSDRPDWAAGLKGASLGELWYSGVLGGVPGR